MIMRAAQARTTKGRDYGVQLRRRIGAYGVCRDGDGRVLLARASAASVRPGTWFLPGGGVEQGEDPQAAVVREVWEETGLSCRVVRLREVTADVFTVPTGLEHTDGVLYDVVVTGGELRPEIDGSTDLARWVSPAEAARLPLSRFAAHVLQRPLPVAAQVPVAASLPAGPAGPPPPRPRRGQRFGAYGLVTDPAGRVLLTLIADGYPGAGRWHLPGGGTDFGEQPADGLLREITEESGQLGRITGLLTVAHQHNPAALGPEGYPIDWHSVRAIFGVAVDRPESPRVLDVGGSTADAAWFTPARMASLRLTDVATMVLQQAVA